MTYEKPRDFVILTIASMGLLINTIEFCFNRKGRKIKEVKRTFEMLFPEQRERLNEKY
jgi:hypothetical protein